MRIQISHTEQHLIKEGGNTVLCLLGYLAAIVVGFALAKETGPIKGSNLLALWIALVGITTTVVSIIEVSWLDLNRLGGIKQRSYVIPAFLYITAGGFLAYAIRLGDHYWLSILLVICFLLLSLPKGFRKVVFNKRRKPVEYRQGRLF